ncbi:hypothetical protein OU798_14280 [Prolixibacteraceae bacterium Z1-6]|uniref:Uncharacterized protein n=1 Tax=Draconibacterium aestuarii TaxID=2998507 RepID=A0A9X3F6L0_9BACT|nr:hypothetical protein [Prolixibacteraceae bacterium Z1-6]
MEFKKLEIEEEGSWIQKKLRNPHTKKTAIYMLIGAVAGFGFFYFTDGMSMDKIPAGDVFQSLFIGAFFGYFITNSPCARGKC